MLTFLLNYSMSPDNVVWRQLLPVCLCLSVFMNVRYVCSYMCTVYVCMYVCTVLCVCMHACMYLKTYTCTVYTWVCIFKFTALSNGSTKSGVQRMTNDQIFLRIHFMCYVFVSLHCPSQSSWNLGRPRSWTWNRYLGNWCVGFYHVSMSSIWIYHNKHFSKVNPFLST